METYRQFWMLGKGSIYTWSCTIAAGSSMASNKLWQYRRFYMPNKVPVFLMHKFNGLQWTRKHRFFLDAWGYLLSECARVTLHLLQYELHGRVPKDLLHFRVVHCMFSPLLRVILNKAPPNTSICILCGWTTSDLEPHLTVRKVGLG